MPVITQRTPSPQPLDPSLEDNLASGTPGPGTEIHDVVLFERLGVVVQLGEVEVGDRAHAFAARACRRDG